MTTVYYVSDSVGVGVRSTILGSNNLFVASGVVVGSSDLYAVGVGGVDNGLDIHGSVHGELGGLSLLHSTDTNINIWEGGSIGSGNEDSFGIAVNNSSAKIKNFGAIHGETAIDLLLNIDCEIVNRGEIRGDAFAIDVDATAVGAISLNNVGTISTSLVSSAAYRSAGNVEDAILNQGKINGVIDLGPGDDRYMGYAAKAMDEGYHAFAMGTKVSAIVSGGDGRDILDGGRYVDLFLGGDDRDMLMGQAGSDQLVGGSGADRLRGGTGGDLFIYAAPADSYHAHRDLIGDFSRSQGDHIELGPIDADVTRAGDQEFKFIGRSGFKGAGELRFEYDNGNTIIQASVDGDRQAEMEIELSGHITLVAGDFSL